MEVSLPRTLCTIARRSALHEVVRLCLGVAEGMLAGVLVPMNLLASMFLPRRFTKAMIGHNDGVVSNR